MNETVRLETTKSDAEKAASYRAELTPLLMQVADIVQRARNEGLFIGFNVTPDQFNRVRIQTIDVTRAL